MPYSVGSKGSYGCSGYPAVKDDGTVMGCHTTRAKAAAQIYAINRSEGNIGKSMVKEGDMVIAPYEEGEVHIGRIIHIMTDGMLGYPGSEYSIMASAEEPAVLIQLFEMEDGGLEETEYFVGHKASEVMAMPSLESNIGMDKAVQNAPYQDYASGMETEEDDEEDEEEDDKIEEARRRMINEELGKKEPNYGEMIKPRRGGSTPSNPKLYARVVQAAKDKFDVYPSAVANSWVVQEYKRRGGTYKMYDEDMDKREFSGAARERMAEAGTAMPDGSFPIANRSDLMNAIRSVGRAKNYDAAKQHIIRRARALNAMDMLPEDWRNKATKGIGEWSGSIFDLNPFVK